jgi:two-component system NtrC family sensor kinase
MRGRGVQTEILVSLAVVMATATGMMALFALQLHDTQTRRFQGLLGRALEREARLVQPWEDAPSGASWFVVDADGVGRALRSNGETLDPNGAELAAAARRDGVPLLRTSLPWQPILFATPRPGTGDVLVAQLASVTPAPAILGLVLADALVFTFLGGYLLRRRVILPLRRLAEAARSQGEEGTTTPVPTDGVAEAAEVAQAFNEMCESLAQRSARLEKALSELRQTNARLRQARDGLDRAERLASVGQLAAGVAHEVGNPMGAVLAFLDLIGRDEELSESSRSHLTRALEQSERVRAILRQLLDFSRPPRPRKRAIDLANVAEQALDLAAAQPIYAGISFELENDDALGSAWADESLASQILLNLVMNAADAVRNAEGGRVRITLRPTALHARAGEDPAAAAGRRRPDAIACVVEDDGAGVAPEDRSRIFDPFYTTKPPGEGTGLGLSNSLRLAEELGGRLDYLESRLGGAAFSLVLPTAAAFQGGSEVRGERADGATG